LRNIILNSIEESNLLVEGLKLRTSSLYTVKDLSSHPFESLILFLFAIIIDLDVTLLSWIDTRVEELLEAFLESLFPKELFVFVLVNEFRCSHFNVMEVIENDLHGTEQLELIFDLDKVVTLARIETSDLNCNRNEIIDNALDDIANTIAS
jgi:hypothetical protein